jgi:ACS family glucarate transporter-like MFS transporter
MPMTTAATSTDSPPAPAATPTGVRYGVLVMLCILAMITYVDRGLLGNSRDDIVKATGTDVAKGYILLVAFQLAYALFEVPSGWMGDRFGPRGTLIRIVLWWSAFVTLTGMAGLTVTIGGTDYMLIGFTALVAIQFFFGMGEAGAFPNITRSLYNWFPATQRGFAQGAVWMSARFGAGMTPLLWLTLTEFCGLPWWQVFLLLGGLAGVWCVGFAWYFRNRPSEHAWTNDAERELTSHGKGSGDPHAHAGVPWGRLVTSPNLWAICGMYFCMNYGWYFFMYFLPGFMKEQFGPTSPGPAAKVVLALFSGGPLLLGMAGCYLGGLLTDAYVRRTGDRRRGRRIYGMLGFGLASAFYLTAVFASSNLYVFAACIAMAGFANDLSLASCWATCQDVGRRFAAIVSGAMNMIGNLGAALTNLVTGMILAQFRDEADRPTMLGYSICLGMFAAAYGIGMFFWLLIDASRPLAGDDEAA